MGVCELRIFQCLEETDLLFLFELEAKLRDPGLLQFAVFEESFEHLHCVVVPRNLKLGLLRRLRCHPLNGL